MSHRRTLFIVVGAIALVLLGGLSAAWYLRSLVSSQVLLNKIEHAAKDRLHVDLTLSSLHISVVPKLRLEITGLVLKNPRRQDLPPLVEIDKCSLQASAFALLRRHPHLQSLNIQGLTINIPPREKGKRQTNLFHTDFLIDHITADNMTLNILHKQGGPPLQFVLHKLRVDSFRPDSPAAFSATLTNPKPVGEIETHGQFGPWNPDDPSQTPVAGSYTFSDADLSTIKGISGTLSSKGTFTGVLDYISVRGSTETPDFELAVAKHPIPLDTDFDAVVDGMNGNTILNSIQIKLAGSRLVAEGLVSKGPRQPGRAVTLSVTTQKAKAQDLLGVAVKSEKPLLKGTVSMKTHFVIPSRRANDTDITNRLQLQGKFQVVSARFTANSVQEKIDALSHRGLGHPKDPDPQSVPSDFAGTFTIRDGVVRFSKLSFTVAGAAVLLNGSYNLDSEQLNMRGSLLLDAKLSQTTTGMKSLLLKLVDPIFKKENAGSKLPIKITGTREKPDFALDLGRVFAEH